MRREDSVDELSKESFNALFFYVLCAFCVFCVRFEKSLGMRRRATSSRSFAVAQDDRRASLDRCAVPKDIVRARCEARSNRRGAIRRIRKIRKIPIPFGFVALLF